MVKQNMAKKPPKGSIRFSLSLSEEQKAAKQAILHHPYNFIVGKAGSGKTLLACQVALDMFFKKQINKIIITRPTVSTEDNGFLPGSEKEKMEPWIVPIKSNMRKIYNKPLILEKMEKDESIELCSLAHFRGRTFENAVVIVDEFQNLTRSQFRMALGRLGKNSTMIFCGDNQQIDLKDKNYSAIHDVPKIDNSQYVYKRVLEDNHRHIAIDEVFELLNGM
jgi:phosphate starvation-inducible protein PhoH and related proteins